MIKLKQPLILSLSLKKMLWIAPLVGLYSVFFVPPINLYFLQFFMFVPILYVYHSNNQHLSKKLVFFYGFWMGIFGMIGNFYWIIHTMIQFGNLPWGGAFVIFLIYSAYIACKFGLIFFFPYLLQKRYHYPVLPSLLISCFFVETLFPEIFPFYIGNHQLYHSYFVQIADIIGVQGISILVVLVNYLIYRFFTTLDKKNLIFILIVFFVTYSYSFLRNIEIQSYRAHHKYITQMSVGVIQPNIPFGNANTQQIDNLKNLLMRQTNQLLETDPALDLIVWPESSLPHYLQSGTAGKEISTFINQLPVPIIYNAAFVENDGNTYSAAIFKKPHSEKIQHYNKNMLLPFGEYLPTDSFYPKLHRYFPEIGDFVPGKEQKNFTLKPNIILSPQICYEITLPYFTRQFIKKGGNVIINITNDSWFGNTKASAMHLFAASFRAIENRVPIVRATNSGISTIIDIKGWSMMTKTKLFTSTTFVQNIPIYLKIHALYSWFGNWPLGLFFTYLFIKMFFAPSVKRRPWFLKQIRSE